MPSLQEGFQEAPKSKGSVSPQTSATPLIPADQRQQPLLTTTVADDGAADERDPVTGKRRFFGLGKKRDETGLLDGMAAANVAATPTVQAADGAVRSASPAKRAIDLKAQPQNIPVSPSRHAQSTVLAASPSRLRSSSPRLHSPASSEIFERNVQDPTPMSTLQAELSPAHIPSHVMTEDHIPPALEASAQAITSEELNPDEVEIVMSTSHQPAAATVLEGSSSHVDLAQLNTPLSKVRSDDSEPTAASSMHHSGILPTSSADEDTANTYGQLDPNDVKRLSFISFADVVQSEHTIPLDAGSGDSLHIGAGGSTASPEPRAASPFRSPRSPSLSLSSAGVTTPPLPGVSVHALNTEQSPARSASGAMVGSPGSSQHGELTIETMRQAVRKTASGDLSAGRPQGVGSPVASAAGDDTGLGVVGRSRTDT